MLTLAVIALVLSMAGNIVQAVRIRELRDLIAPLDRDGDGKPGGSKPRA